MAEDSVAQDQLRAFIERIERMEEEKAGIAEDIKEIYGEAKGNGFDTKILRKIVAIRKQDANERAEQEAVLDLYMSALGMVAAPPEDVDYTPSFGANVRRAPATLDDLVEQLADQVDPKLLMNIIEGSKTEAGRKIIMGALASVNEGDVVSTAHIQNTQTQPYPQAGSDLTTSHALGQVAQIQPETATEAHSPAATPADANAGGENVAADDDAHVPDDHRSHENGERADALALGSDVEAVAPKSLYAEPGVVVWESAPPEGVARHPYSNLFGYAGQDIAVIQGDLEAANSAPIVKIGNLILDGWARYTMARSMFTEVLEDGVTKRIPLEYPVVQYDGTDPLIDCIKWNLDGRLMTSEQKFRVAQALTRMEPKRKADIYAAFELETEMAI